MWKLLMAVIGLTLVTACGNAAAQQTNVATLPTAAPGVVGTAAANDADFQYPFQCNQASLTADLKTRGQIAESVIPEADWYTTDADGEYVGGGWGPHPVVYSHVQVPANAGCDAVTWQQERVLAVALRYLNNAGNPNALDYRHHHIPAWSPPTNTHVSGDNGDPETNDLGAWGAGTGLDCSNFVSWVYNFGLGIKFTSSVTALGKPSLGVPAKALPKEGPFQPGDLLYLHPNSSDTAISHVVIYIDDSHIIDDRYDYTFKGKPYRGVHVRSRVGWYRNAVLGGWRIVGE